MTPCRTFYTLFFVFIGMGSVHGQDASLQSLRRSTPTSKTIALTVPSGTPLQIALDKEVRIRKVGQHIHGRLVQPIYAFDHLVIPVGTEVTGHISRINGISGKQRTLGILNVDLTPAHPI
jgi:hypothetical protein